MQAHSKGRSVNKGDSSRQGASPESTPMHAGGAATPWNMLEGKQMDGH